MFGLVFSIVALVMNGGMLAVNLRMRLPRWKMLVALNATGTAISLIGLTLGMLRLLYPQ